MDLELLLEAERRGILPPEKVEVLNEARRRGLVDAPAPQSAPRDGVVRQGMSGVNEGMAAIAGFPVDTATSLVNLIPGVDIQDPVGGSGTFRDVMGSAISENEPQTAAERYARSIGRETGAMVVPGLGAAAKAEKPARLLIAELLSSVGAGTAGQAVEDIAPEADNIRMIAELLGGGAPIALSHAATRGPQAPSLDDLRTRQSQAYGRVDQSTARLSPDLRDELVDRLQTASDMTGIDEVMHPAASRTMARMDLMSESPTIGEVEQARRLIKRDVMGSNVPAEQQIGATMRQELDDYLTEIAESGAAGPEVGETLDYLAVGRTTTRQIKADEALQAAANRGSRRAATSGTGGNEVNAIRQNLRAILDSQGKPKGAANSFTPDELATMEDIVRGTPTVNAARMVGRFSPTSGALPAFAGIGGAMYSPELALAGAGLGYGAKATAEALTQRQISTLSDAIRNGGPVAGKELSDSNRRLIAALLAAQAPNQEAAANQ